jgi:hypothetical protein
VAFETWLTFTGNGLVVEHPFDRLALTMRGPGGAEGHAAGAVALTPDSSALAAGQVKRQVTPEGA